jgi:hypothetical protein
VAVALRHGGEGVEIDLPPGDYRDVLSGGAHAIGGATPLSRLVDAHGLALLERA